MKRKTEMMITKYSEDNPRYFNVAGGIRALNKREDLWFGSTSDFLLLQGLPNALQD